MIAAAGQARAAKADFIVTVGGGSITDGAKAVLAQYESLDPAAEADTLIAAYQVFVQQNLPSLPYPSTTGMQTVLTEAISANPDAAKVTLDQLIDPSLETEIDYSDFMPPLSN